MKFYWTDHSKIKMRQYALSKSKLLQLISRPERKEKGIAAGTIAVMQTRKTYTSFKAKTTLVKMPFKKAQAPGEIWLMYKDEKNLRKIISAWRYPGISKPGEPIPIPEEIRQELNHYEYQ